MAFLGAATSSACSVICKFVDNCASDRVFVGCSGHYTIERALRAHGFKGEIYSNDVTLYSSAIGEFLAGGGLEWLALRSDCPDYAKFLQPYLAGGTCARLACFLVFADLFSKRECESSLDFYKQSYSCKKQMFAKNVQKMCEKLEVLKKNVPIQGFCGEDVVDFVKRVAGRDVFLCFPPFWTGGYEKQFEWLKTVFFYREVKYKVFDEARRKELLSSVGKMNNFLVMLDQKSFDSSYLSGVVRASSRGHKVAYLYAKNSGGRVQPMLQRSAPLKTSSFLMKACVKDCLGEEAYFVPIRVSEFNALYCEYFNVQRILSSQCNCFAFVSKGKIFGCCSFRKEVPGMKMLAEIEKPAVWLQCHFVIPCAEKRLAKLMLQCVRCNEMRIALSDLFGVGMRSVVTVAFSEHCEVNMYRGTGFRKLKVAKQKEGEHCAYKLTYFASFCDDSLKGVFNKWKQR